MNQLNNPLWPFAIHNGQRTEASKALIRQARKDTDNSLISLQVAVEAPDKVTDTHLEEDALF